MWFKNLYIYRFTKPFEMGFESLDTALSQAQFKPCGPHDTYQLGWSSPLGKNSEALVHVTDKYWMVCLTKQEKILPSSVVNEQVNERAELIEQEQHRKVSRKEKSELKEQITIELMPKAFVRTSAYYAYICPLGGYMVVNTSSAKVADEVTSYLRKTLGSLPVRPIEVNQSPAQVMTQWLTDDTTVPQALTLGLECELKTTGEEKGQIKYKGLDLDIEQIQQHITSGMMVEKVSASWADKIEFMLQTDLTLKRLKFTDLVQEKFDDTNAEGAAEKFDASFAIMASEIDLLIPELLEAFGGEDRSAIIEN